MILAISFTAFLASILTFLSGFGLGTLLMPVMAMFFPVFAAIAITAIVHLMNNLFKLILMVKHLDHEVLLKFGIPALLSSLLGAYVLTEIVQVDKVFKYFFFGINVEITIVKLVVGILLMTFAIAEFISVQNKFVIHKKWLPAGGVLSGFFGGLSGHQGAFRSVFLVHLNLDKNAFVATNSAIASLVDIARIVIYGLNFSVIAESGNSLLIILACISAFAGAITGKYFLKKITIVSIQMIIAVLLLALGLLLILGVI